MGWRFVGIMLFLAGPVGAQEWTRFRGPNGSGLGKEFQLPDHVKDFAWKVKLPGVGHSSPVLWQDKIFLTSGEEATGKRIVQCLEAGNGKERWRRDFAGNKHGKHKDNSFASSTPVVDEQHLVLCWADPKEFLVQALDHEGKELWKVDLGPFKAGHGFGASPILFEDLVVVPNEQDGESKLVALDVNSGKILWQVPRKTRSHYATPCLYEPKGGQAQLLFASWEHGLTSLDPRDGKANWELDIFDKDHPESSIASPLVAKDKILATCGYLGVRQEIVAVQMAGNKPKEPEAVVYKLDKAAPLVPTPLVKDGLLFSWNDRGVVSCLDLETGKEYWRERVAGNYYSSPVCLGSRLYCVSREGDLAILAAAKEFALVNTIPLGEGSHSTPALAQGSMFVRTFTHLLCLR